MAASARGQVIRLGSTSQLQWRDLLNQPRLTILCWSMPVCLPLLSSFSFRSILTTLIVLNFKGLQAM